MDGKCLGRIGGHWGGDSNGGDNSGRRGVGKLRGGGVTVGRGSWGVGGGGRRWGEGDGRGFGAGDKFPGSPQSLSVVWPLEDASLASID